MERGSHYVTDSTSEPNNMCLIYTVDKGYHSATPYNIPADTERHHNTLFPSDVTQLAATEVTEFTDLSQVSATAGANEGLSLGALDDYLNSSIDTNMSESLSVAGSVNKPFQTYGHSLQPRQARSGDTKTVTFSGADQIVLLSPARSVDSSQSIPTPEPERRNNNETAVTDKQKQEETSPDTTGSGKTSPEKNSKTTGNSISSMAVTSITVHGVDNETMYASTEHSSNEDCVSSNENEMYNSPAN